MMNNKNNRKDEKVKYCILNLWYIIVIWNISLPNSFFNLLIKKTLVLFKKVIILNSKIGNLLFLH